MTILDPNNKFNATTLAVSSTSAFTGKITATGGVASVVEQMMMGLPGTVAVNTFPFNATTLTEATSTFCKIDDGTVFQDLATSSSGAGITANYQLAPDTAAENDAVYFGAAAPFGIMYMDMSATVQVYAADSVTWEYYDGSTWSTLTILYDQTDTDDQEGERPFQGDGYIVWSAPSDWASTTVDSQAAYWVRARYNATVNVSTAGLTNSKEHQTLDGDSSFETTHTGSLGRLRFTWDTASAANNDTKFILCNLTDGTASAVQTLTQALQDFDIADVSMSVTAGDELALFITQEDGTTEFADGMLTLDVTTA